jgi:hypothetical protein
MSISAKIVLDSITTEGVRVTTFELRYPRYIHADMMTHRVFSRNASSSRAKPLKKFLEEETVFPITYGSNISGMQAGSELSWPRRTAIMAIWGSMAYINGLGARMMAKLGLHKQWVNRPVEWFTHINVLVTATDFNNFFALRYHSDAQPELTELARQMFELYRDSKPYALKNDSWHLPYITHKDICRVYSPGFVMPKIQTSCYVRDLETELLIRVSVARCARVSYKSHDGKETTVEQDLALYDRLLAGVPLHASPAEHQCRPDYRCYHDKNDFLKSWQHPYLHGNLTGTIQYRKLLPGEHQKDFNPDGEVH